MVSPLKNTDDENSKSLDLLKELYGKVDLYVHDPMAMEQTKLELEDMTKINYVHDWKSNFSKMNCIILMTNWKNIKLD